MWYYTLIDDFMDKNNLQQLIDKYLQGTMSTEEREHLLHWYRQQHEQESIWELLPSETEQLVRERIKANIWKNIEPDQQIIRKRRYWSYVAVASSLVLITFAILMQPRSAQLEEQVSLPKSEDNDNRFILLPDSSRVVLRPGSKLIYPSVFDNASREVSLEGEAYFDIKHKNNQPFIIHTGEVKTTVLGTAFTIKYPIGSKKVEVLVERGKVRVEDKKHVLAELTADQKINLNEQISKPEIEKVNARLALEWKRQDMTFDAEAFRDISKSLEKRYGVTLQFVNSGLGNCPITGKFTGSETIDEVLMNICATRNASYRQVGVGRYEIQGEGCP
jgi:transmembrane sensor